MPGRVPVRRRPRLDSASMRAATIRDGEVVVAEHPDPEPGAGEVLVRVRAAGLNGADILQRAGHYPAPPGSPPDIPGLELAGEVVGARPGRRALRRGRPRDGRSSAAAARPSSPSSTSASSCRCPTALDWTAGRRRARGLHHRPRRALHPGRAARRRAPARPRRRRRRRHRRRSSSARRPAPASPRRVRNEDLRDERRRRSAPTRSIDPEGFDEHGPVRRRPRARRRPQPRRRPRRRSPPAGGSS